MTGEFRHHTITQTFLITPDRGRVVAAKLVAYPLAAIVLALATLAVTAAVATGWLAAKGITPSLLDARLGRVVGVALLGAGLCGLVGVGVAALVRNQVAALVGTVVWVAVVEGLLMSLLNVPSLGKWLPSAAAKAAITSPGGAQLSRVAGSLVLAGYALALALVGTRLVVRRDIT
jgi:ABC-2 type transport system permease protein